ncbi:MAG: cold shock domain-containing protein [Chloroflexi bacterium]|nr:cold shock domain-containing protein [Chloroflexota bacterium]
MSYQDTWATCTSCGARFVFRIEEQRQQTQRGEPLTPPELCPSCRGGAPQPEPRERLSQPERPHSTKKEVIGPGPHEGAVKWYDNEKGYGFITQSDGKDIFFHRTGIAPVEKPAFPDGTSVTYCIEQSERGPQAVEVERLHSEDQ